MYLGLLVNGEWQDAWFETTESAGRFVRRRSTFRNWVRRDGSTRFPPEAGRYHLYVSYACPWAHRTLIFRAVKKLEDAIGISVVDPVWNEQGWWFSHSGETSDKLGHFTQLHEVYTSAEPEYTGRVTVPILWDRQENAIVSNESSEIIRMFNVEFNDMADASIDLYPEALRAEIDEVNARVYDAVNNGVYKAGFASTQDAYEEAYDELFEVLDELEEGLGEQRYLVGDQTTEADWRLFTTLVRFDSVYFGHFKCNKRRIVDYPNLWGYTRELYQFPGVAETVRLDHIKSHYYASHRELNPTGIVPVGPDIDFTQPHGRG